MSITLNKQIQARDSLAYRIEYEWKQICSKQQTMKESHKIFERIKDSKEYLCLSKGRKYTISFLWEHTRKMTLRDNEVYGRWYNGIFIDCWTKLPEEIRYDNDKLKKLPTGFFWRNQDGSVSQNRYFISSDCKDEDYLHFELHSEK